MLGKKIFQQAKFAKKRKKEKRKYLLKVDKVALKMAAKSYWV